MVTRKKVQAVMVPTMSVAQQCVDDDDEDEDDQKQLMMKTMVTINDFSRFFEYAGAEDGRDDGEIDDDAIVCPMDEENHDDCIFLAGERDVPNVERRKEKRYCRIVGCGDDADDNGDEGGDDVDVAVAG